VFGKQLFGLKKLFLKKAILPNLLGRVCGIDIIVQKFEIITSNIIKK